MTTLRSVAAIRTHASPELVAALLVSLLATTLVSGSFLVAQVGPAGASANPGGSASRSLLPATPDASAGAQVDSASLAAILAVNADLASLRQSLVTELRSPPVDTTVVATALRQANVQLRFGLDLAKRLATGPSTARLAADLTSLYTDVSVIAAKALALSLLAVEPYREAARAFVARLAVLNDLDARANGLLATGIDPILAPQLTSSPIGSPYPVVTPTPPASPAGSLNMLENPGFEDSAEAGWLLIVADPEAKATMTADPADPASGRLSVRIEIESPSTSRSGIALHQGGLRIDSGTRYSCSIQVRAAAQREINVRIVGATGETYDSRIFTAEMEWQRLSFDFSVFTSDPLAALEVDLGRSSVTTWLDDVSLTAIPPDQAP